MFATVVTHRKEGTQTSLDLLLSNTRGRDPCRKVGITSMAPFAYGRSSKTDEEVPFVATITKTNVISGLPGDRRVIMIMAMMPTFVWRGKM